MPDDDDVFLATPETIARGRALRVVLHTRQHTPMSWRHVIAGWRDEAAFRSGFTEILRALPFDAFFWETPPITATTVERPFEFVATDAPSLRAVAPDQRSFAEHLDEHRGTNAVATFASLGGDALLVAPAQNGPAAHHAHLAAFVRSASADHVHALWRATGDAVGGRLSERPLWVSTSGAGVAWLHVRLDSAPKYYTHAPYRREPPPRVSRTGDR